MILGLAGRAGTGKSTIANHLIEKYGFQKYSFAEPLKQMLLNAGMCSREELYGEKTANSRWLMQKIGTEIFKKQVDKDYWIKKAHENLSGLGSENIVIDDVRFPEEADWITGGCSRRLQPAIPGFIIRVVRKNYIDAVAGFGHDSERLLNKIVPDFLIKAKSGDIKSLIEQADAVMKKLGSLVVET